MRPRAKIFVFSLLVVVPALLLWLWLRPWPKPDMIFLGIVEKDGKEIARFEVHYSHHVNFSYRAYADGLPWMEGKSWSGSDWVLMRTDCYTGWLAGTSWRILPPDGTIQFEVGRPLLPGDSYRIGIPFVPKVITNPPVGAPVTVHHRTFWETCEAKLRRLDGSEWYAWSEPVTFTK